MFRLLPTLTLLSAISILCALCIEVTLTFGPKIGPNRTYGLEHARVQTSKGLVAIPINGGEAVSHRRMFQHATTMYVDRINNLLWVLFNSTVGGAVYNMTEWTNADLANPDFNPAPVFRILPENYTDFLSNRVSFFSTGRYPGTAILGTHPTVGPFVDFNAWLPSGFVFIGGLYANSTGVDVTDFQLSRVGNLNRIYFLFNPSIPGFPYSAIGFFDYDGPYFNVNGYVHSHTIAISATRGAFMQAIGNNSLMVLGIRSRGLVFIGMNETHLTDIVGEYETTSQQNVNNVGVLPSYCIRQNDIDDSPFVFLNVPKLEDYYSLRTDLMEVEAPPPGSESNATVSNYGPLQNIQTCITYGSRDDPHDVGLAATSNGEIIIYNISNRNEASGERIASVKNRYNLGCTDYYLAGRWGDYLLAHHFWVDTCNCPDDSETLCALGIEIGGPKAAELREAFDIDPYMIDTIHYRQAFGAMPISKLSRNFTLPILVGHIQSVLDENISRTGCPSGPLIENMTGYACMLFSPSSTSPGVNETCSFEVKVDKCTAAGASAIVIVNSPYLPLMTFTAMKELSIPAIMIPYELGVAIADVLAMPNPPEPVSRTPAPSNQIGIIVGGAVGGSVFLLLVVGLLVYFLVIRKNLAYKDYVEELTSTTSDPFKSFDQLQSLLAVDASWSKKTSYFEKPLSPDSREYAEFRTLFAEALDGQDLLHCISKYASCRSDTSRQWRVYAVANPELVKSFSTYRKTIAKRHQQEPQLFCRNDWQSLDRFELRKQTMDVFQNRVAKFPWNSLQDDGAPVIPVIHGTSGSITRKIMELGLSNLSTLDAGYYGAGMYFTSSANYAIPYFVTADQPALLICLLIPGNPFPVVEERNEKNSLLGSPLKSGYQSHYVLTEISGTPVTRIDPSKNHHYDEIVVIQEAQSLDMKYVLNEIREIVSGKSEAILPFVIVEFDKEAAMTYCSDFQRRSQISLTQFLERGVSQTSREVRLNIGDFPPPAISPSVSSPQTRQPSSSATHNETPAPLPSSGQKRPASMRPKLENTQVGPILRNSTVRSPPNQSELSSHSLSAQVDSTVSNEPLDPDDIASEKQRMLEKIEILQRERDRILKAQQGSQPPSNQGF